MATKMTKFIPTRRRRRRARSGSGGHQSRGSEGEGGGRHAPTRPATDHHNVIDGVDGVAGCEGVSEDAGVAGLRPNAEELHRVTAVLYC